MKILLILPFIALFFMYPIWAISVPSVAVSPNLGSGSSNPPVIPPVKELICPTGQHVVNNVCIDDIIIPPSTEENPTYHIVAVNNVFSFNLNQTDVTVCSISCDYPISTAGLTNAIAFVSDNGGGKIILTGTLQAHYPIILKSNIWLEFDSGAKIIWNRNDTTSPLNRGVLDGNSVYNIYLHNVDIESNYPTISGIYLAGSSNHIVINGTDSYINMVEGNNSRDIHCDITCRYFSLDNGEYSHASRNINIGAFIEPNPTLNCRYIYIHNIEAHHSAIEGIKVNGCSDVLIDNNVAHNNANNNIDIGRTLRANVSNNNVQITSHSNIHMDKAHEARVTNNDMYDSAIRGIAVCGSTDSIVSDNNIYNPHGNGIDVTSCSASPKNNVIQYNFIENATKNGIYISSVAIGTEAKYNVGCNIDTPTYAIVKDADHSTLVGNTYGC